MSNPLPLFTHELIKWYTDNSRILPWRETKDPYLIWISEIILQQTRVAQGYDYYIRFIKAFPNVDSLANADENSVLKLWQGLGYYSRARNLHQASKTIRDCYNGQFPSNYNDIISLKGIGQYTAAAIASFAFDLPYAVLDGNVFRFLSRLFAINTPIDTSKGKKEFQELANLLLDRQNPALYNQAIMEFGALQCVPQAPNCQQCCLADKCLAYGKNEVGNYPVKIGKTNVKVRYFNYFDINDQDFIYLKKRIAKDIWMGLYELPLIETSYQTDIVQLQGEPAFRSLFAKPDVLRMSGPIIKIKHILSHQVIHAAFYQICVNSSDKFEDHYVKVKRKDLVGFPVSRLVERYFQK